MEIMANSLSDIYGGVKQNSEHRRENDLYSTPPLVIYAFLKTYDGTVPNNIIEPCAGKGYISKELISNGHNVISFDLFKHYETLQGINITTPVDLFTHDYSYYGGVITNPPYHKRIPIRLIEKTTKECNFSAFILRTTFLESANRYTFFKDNPPTSVWVLSDRMNCDFEDDLKNKQIGGMVSYSIYVWDKNSENKQMLNWIRLKDFYPSWIKDRC